MTFTAEPVIDLKTKDFLFHAWVPIVSSIPVYFHLQRFLFLAKNVREEFSPSIPSDVIFSSPPYFEYLETY